MKIKDIALSAAYVGQRVVKAICVGAQEVWSAVKYIVFKDPVVAQICATNWGDGVGITEEQAAKVTSIGNAFKSNAEIISFEEFEKFTGISTIGGYTFQSCSNLQAISIPRSVTKIGSGAFMGATKLERVNAYSIEAWCNIVFDDVWASPTYAGGNLYIDGKAIGDVVIPSSISKINNYAFCADLNITSLDIPNSVKSIGLQAFINCKNLASITIPNSLETIGQNCFNGSGLQSIDLPSSLTSIASGTFRNCSQLENADMKDGIKSIGVSAFEQCRSLQYIDIPSSVESIENQAFYVCTAVKLIICRAVTPPTLGTSVFAGYNTPIYVPDESVEAYKTASNWNTYASRIKSMSEYVES